MEQNKALSPQTPEKNHRNQMIIQVWLPLSIILALVLGCMVWVVILATGGNASISQAADVSLILMILPLFLAGIVSLLVILFAIIVNSRIAGNIPTLGAKIHLFILRIQIFFEKFSSAVTNPVIKARSATYAAGRTFSRRKS